MYLNLVALVLVVKFVLDHFIDCDCEVRIQEIIYIISSHSISIQNEHFLESTSHFYTSTSVASALFVFNLAVGMCGPSDPHTYTKWSTERAYSFNFLGPIAKSNERLEVITKVSPRIIRMVLRYEKKMWAGKFVSNSIFRNLNEIMLK